MLEGSTLEEFAKLDLLTTPEAIHQGIDVQNSLAIQMQEAGTISVPKTLDTEFEVAGAGKALLFTYFVAKAHRSGDSNGDPNSSNPGGSGYDWATSQENVFAQSSERYVKLIEDIEAGNLDLNFESTESLGAQLFRMQDDFRDIAAIERKIDKKPSDIMNDNLPEGSVPMTEERINNAQEVFSGLATQIVVRNAVDNPEYGGLQDAVNVLSRSFIAPSLDLTEDSRVHADLNSVSSFPGYVRIPSNETLGIMGITLEEYQQTVNAEYMIGRDIYKSAANDHLEKILNLEQEFYTKDVATLDSLIQAMALIDERIDPDRSLDSESDRLDAARQRIYGEELNISQEQMDAWKMEKTVQSINRTLTSWNERVFECSSAKDFGKAADDNEMTYGNIRNWANSVGLDIEEGNRERLSEAGVDIDALETFNDRRHKLIAMDESGGPNVLSRVGDWLKDSDSTGCYAAPTSS